MDEPLATAAGNAVEVRNAIDYLTGRRQDKRLHEVTLALGTELLVSASLETSEKKAREKLLAALASGRAAKKFQSMVSALGGPHDLLERPDPHLPSAPLIRAVHADDKGTVQRIDTRSLGLAVIELGGGRRVASDRIDHAVGLTQLAGKGLEVSRDVPLALIHARDDDSFDRAAQIVKSAYHLGPASRKAKPVIARIGPG
jgi:thymidine phosphorylase